MNRKLIKTSYITAVLSFVFMFVQVGLFYLYNLSIVNRLAYDRYTLTAAEEFLLNPDKFIYSFLLSGIIFTISSGLLVNFIIYHLTEASKSKGIYLAGIILSVAIFTSIQVIPLIYFLMVNDSFVYFQWMNFSIFNICIFALAFALFSVKFNRKF